ncbi:uncharacterized protein METZ01_LOCUS388852, partial [marine metagenome]
GRLLHVGDRRDTGAPVARGAWSLRRGRAAERSGPHMGM